MVNRTNSDERLADLTDRLLAGKKPEGMVMTDSDKDLSRAEETIHLLQRALPDRQPDLELQNRIRAKLTAEWSKTGPGVQKETSMWRSARQTQRTLVLRFALAAIVILVVVLAAFPFSNLTTPGAAGKISLWAPLGIGAITIIFAIWQIRKNKRR